MPRVNLKQVPKTGDFSILPIGRYAARLKVDAYMHDPAGAPMLTPDGEPLKRTTRAGDDMWNLEWHLLDPQYNGKKILDNFNFSSGGLKRVTIPYTRGGFATGEEEDINLEPEDLDGTYWWIEVEHPDPEERSKKSGTPVKVSKYPHKKGNCRCATCEKYDGKNVAIFPSVSFGGMEPMKPDEVAKYLKPPPNGAAGICTACSEGKHYHKRGVDGCACPVEEHLDF